MTVKVWLRLMAETAALFVQVTLPATVHAHGKRVEVLACCPELRLLSRQGWEREHMVRLMWRMSESAAKIKLFFLSSLHRIAISGYTTSGRSGG